MLQQYGSTDSCDKEDNNYGVHTWASGFEKLLKDPVGLQTFAVSKLLIYTLKIIEIKKKNY